MKKKILIPILLIVAIVATLASCGGKAVTDITIISGMEENYELYLNETPDFTNIQVKVLYNDDTYVLAGYNDLEIGSIDTSTPGDKDLVIKYGDFEKTFKIVVDENEAPTPIVLNSISYHSGLPAKVFVGDTLDTSALKIQANYSDNTTPTVNASELTIGNIDTSTEGEKILRVSYKGKSVDITVNVIGVDSLIVDSTSVTKTVMKGESFDFSELLVSVKYKDNTVKPLSSADYTLSTVDTATGGEKTLTVSYLEKTADVTLYVDEMTGIQIVPSSIDTVRPEGVVTPIDYSDIKLNATYRYQNPVALDFEVSDLTVTQPVWTDTDKYFTVTYLGFTASVKITETEPVIVSIEVNANSIASTVVVGESLDTGNLSVTAVYDNGAQETLYLSNPEDKLALAAFSTNNVGDLTITVTYNNSDITASTTVKVLGVTGLAVSGINATVIIGEELILTGASATATYSDNTTALIPYDKLTIVGISTDTKGTYNVKVTYKNFTEEVPVEVLTVSSITVDTSTVPSSVEQGGTLNVNNIVISATLSDGSTVTRNLADGVTVSALDTSTTGTKHITVEFKGASTDVTVVVTAANLDYYITAIEPSQSLTSFEANKQLFRNPSKYASTKYAVGDDNAFVFALKIRAYNENAELVTINTYTGKTNVYIYENGTPRLLAEGSERDAYVFVDESKHTLDFTSAAVGHSFKIETKPLLGADDFNPITLDVDVVDAYNVYNAYELNIITNTTDGFDFSEFTTETRTQVEIVDAFLAGKNITRPEKLAGIVIHKDLSITTSDIPSEYLFKTNDYSYNYIDNDGTQKEKKVKGSYEFYDFFSVFYRELNASNPEFSIHGNFFTVNTASLPTVAPVGQGGNGVDGASSSQVFRFAVADSVTGNLETFVADYDKYKTNINNVYMRDNDPNSNVAADSQRHMRGLIAMKYKSGNVNITSSIVEAYYISTVVEHDYSTVNLTDSKFYNAWQNHIFLWSHNSYQSHESVSSIEDIYSGHKPIVMNVINSELSKCGGPVIITQTKTYQETEASDPIIPARNLKSKSIVNIDEASKDDVYTYVTGQEAWFVQMGVTPMAALIKTLNRPLNNVSGGAASFLTTNAPGYEGVEVMNIVMLNMEAAYKIPEGTNDIDGQLYIADELILDMDDGDYGNYGNPYISGVKASAYAAAPAIQSSAGGVGIIIIDENDISNSGSDAVYGISAAGTPAAPDKSLFTGDYLTLYHKGMGIVLGYNY